ncbi:DUF5895 domain-containing protein [Cronbergia sp. UHCC 0137]|uniref:DUF5895 domain-containing protein n=1 Tax=Cronbergia sp. UHCC 0137 TaxID=3110239 RepID=UPI002B1F5D77|nr:DUF5895 domain-containing protein [Cronbergia sp. UHCC 0137]MEA5619938.1 DUF5895 domain-containing protein [Cronbergia sp. UHCC 0137]
MVAKKTVNNAETVKTDIVDNTSEVENDISSEFELDPSLLSDEFNCRRQRRFAYGIVVNSETSGLFIPEKNLAKCGWFANYELVEKDLSGGVEKGIFITNARMIILGAIKPYIRYKTDKDKNGDMAGVMVGWYSSQEQIVKETMDVVSEHLVMFLDTANNFLHESPIRIRFKNVALWSLVECLETIYTQAESSFARMINARNSSKDDRWRSLCVIDVVFKGVKEGNGANKSYCCKINNFIKPDEENFSGLFLGTKFKMIAALEKYDIAIGFDENIKALVGSSQLALSEGED